MQIDDGIGMVNDVKVEEEAVNEDFKPTFVKKGKRTLGGLSNKAKFT